MELLKEERNKRKEEEEKRMTLENEILRLKNVIAMQTREAATRRAKAIAKLQHKYGDRGVVECDCGSVFDDETTLEDQVD